MLMLMCFLGPYLKALSGMPNGFMKALLVFEAADLAKRCDHAEALVKQAVSVANRWLAHS